LYIIQEDFMLGRDIALLVDMTKERETRKDDSGIIKEIAEKLDINIKTFNSWINEKVDYRIGRPYVAYLRRIFEPLLFKERLHALEESVFEKVPSEFIGFWVVCGTEVILLKDTARNALFPVSQRYFNDEIHKRLTDISTTIDAIQETRVINVFDAGDGIYKGNTAPHTVTHHLSGRTCFSMLKVPIVTRSSIGPRVVGLVDLRNKLASVNCSGWEPVQRTPGNRSTDTIFTNEDIELIRQIAYREFDTNLRKLMEALDYFDPDTSPHSFGQ
jgi:hypothetical protein